VQTEKLQTELKFLKAQLNPHFLFNCLNTIYFQIDKTNSVARGSLEKFSELLRYQLYECNEEQIPIEKETSYLESYVDLQKMRKNNNYEICFEKEAEVKDFSIAPLLLLPFVENAFKYLSDNHDQKNIVKMNMTRNNGTFSFFIRNSVSREFANENSSGIGLKNARRRLDLLYENRYKLNIAKTNDEFSVLLEIKLQ
jgi:LytS/YehU family sensor histidine kinase